MPDTQPVTVSAPAPEGTSLWNIQTQSPEYIPLSQVKARLDSGVYRTYAGSDVGVAPGIGAEGSLGPEAAATAITGGATPTHTEAARGAKAREAEYSSAFDSAGDRALAVADGAVSGLSGGLLPGLVGSDYANLIMAKRGEEHGGYKTLGELAALATTALAPESALRYSPLGITNEIFGGAAKATEAALAAKVGSKVLRRGISDAVGGAVASGALSSANAVSNAVQGKPVSGYAIVDDIGLGAAIGFGIGAVSEGLSLSARKATDIKTQVQAAARFDESALPIRGILAETSSSWHSAHTIGSARVDALEDLVKSGMLDADMPGKEWLAARTTARDEANAAQAKLHKLAETDDPVKVAERLHDLAISGKAKDAQKLYEAFDNYGTAVSKLDDALQPTTYDTAHLHDVIGDIDLTIPADEHPYQRLEQMINNGVPTEEIDRFAKDLDSSYNKITGKDTEIARAPTMDLPAGTPDHLKFGASPDSVTGAIRTPDINIKPSTEATTIHGEPGDITVKRVESPGAVQEPAPRKLATDINTPGDMDKIKSKLLGGSTAGNEEAGFRAKKILDQARQERATGVMGPVRPTDLGRKIQSLMDQLTAATGNRLGSTEARKLANELGMNTAALNGPVSQKLGDLWALHRMSSALAGVTGKGANGGTLKKAIGWGVSNSMGSIAYEAGGPFASGAVRSLMHHAVSSALYGAASLTAVAGRFRQAAVNGLAKALNPTTRRALGLAGIYKVVSASYEPNSPPTTDYQTKADQLRRVQQNPDPVKTHLQQVFKGIGAVDPAAYTAAVDAAMTRLGNLASALPKNASLSLTLKSRGPSDTQIAEFHAYEAVTANRELVFKYLKAGLMPQGVVSAMNEQHPDFMNELREYVLNNQEEVQSAPYNTKLALSRLLGVPLVPAATPDYVINMQQPYIDAKNKASQQQTQNKGSSALHATPPTTVQIIQLPQGAH